MRDLLIPFMLGAVVVPASADSLITASSEVLPSLDGSEFTQLWNSSDDYLLMASSETRQNRNRQQNRNQQRNNNRNVQQVSRPVRTRWFTGLHYNEADFDNNWNTKTLTKNLIDATTIFNENFRLSYSLDEVSQKAREGAEKQEDRVNYQITPRFNQWVSPNFNYFVQATYRRSFQRNSNTQTVYRLKPGANWSFGPNTFSLSGQYSHVDHNGNRVWNINPSYNRRLSQRMNMNFSAAYSRTKKDNNDDGSHNYNVSGAVNYRFTSFFRANFNYQYGKNGNDDKFGYKSHNFNVNTTTKLSENFDLIANVGYQIADRYYRNIENIGGGDRKRITGKIGIRTEF